MALSPIPSDAPITGAMVKDPRSGKLIFFMSDDFNNWLLEQQTRLNNSPESVGDSLSLTAQTASLAATPAYVATTQGMYRVSLYGRVTTPAGVNSSLIVTAEWTDDGVNCSASSTAATGNTTATTALLSVTVRSDQAASLNVSTTYASTPAAAMAYDLVATVEQVPV